MSGAITVKFSGSTGQVACVKVPLIGVPSTMKFRTRSTVSAGTSIVAPVSSTRSSTWSTRNASGASITNAPVLETVMFVSRASACSCAVWNSNAPPSARM